jgi:hypothetical protein
MTKKKPRKYKPAKYQWVVSSDRPMYRIDLKEIDISPESRMLFKPSKRTLHSLGGLIKGKPKLAKKGWK